MRGSKVRQMGYAQIGRLLRRDTSLLILIHHFFSVSSELSAIIYWIFILVGVWQWQPSSGHEKNWNCAVQ